jgi:hypothetical protein
MEPHLTRKVSEDLSAVFELDTKEGVRKSLGNSPDYFIRAIHVSHAVIGSGVGSAIVTDIRGSGQALL